MSCSVVENRLYITRIRIWLSDIVRIGCSFESCKRFRYAVYVLISSSTHSSLTCRCMLVQLLVTVLLHMCTVQPYSAPFIKMMDTNMNMLTWLNDEQPSIFLFVCLNVLSEGGHWWLRRVTGTMNAVWCVLWCWLHTVRLSTWCRLR